MTTNIPEPNCPEYYAELYLKKEDQENLEYKQLAIDDFLKPLDI